MFLEVGLDSYCIVPLWNGEIIYGSKSSWNKKQRDWLKEVHWSVRWTLRKNFAQMKAKWWKLLTNNVAFRMAYVGFQNKGVAWVYSREEDEALDDAFFSGITSRLTFENRRALLHSGGYDDFPSLRNGEGDGFGGVTLTGTTVLSWSLGIARCLSLPWPDFDAGSCFVWRRQRVYEKIRFKNEADLPESQFVGGIEAPEPLIVLENEVITTYMNEGLMTNSSRPTRSARNDSPALQCRTYVKYLQLYRCLFCCCSNGWR